MGKGADPLNWGVDKANQKIQCTSSNKLPRLQPQQPPVALFPGFIAHNFDVLEFNKEQKALKTYVSYIDAFAHASNPRSIASVRQRVQNHGTC